MTPTDQSPKDESIDRQNMDLLFMKICETIAELSERKYQELRTWIVLRPKLENWQALMKS